MSRFSLVLGLCAVARQSRHASQKRRLGVGRRLAGFRPRLEVLGERTLPSTFLVTNLNDSGPDTLRAAVQAADASSGAVIDFAPNLHGTITLTSGQPAAVSAAPGEPTRRTLGRRRSRRPAR